jgi:NADH-quinone oxidoreductase subunit N
MAVAAANAEGAKALLYYLIPYGAASLGAFAVVAARERELGEPVTLDNLSGFGWERPAFGVAMWAFMLTFAGLPPTGGFVGKFFLFAALEERGWTWLIVVGVVATAVSLYYYLAIIRSLYLRQEVALVPVAGGSPPPERVLGVSVAVCAVVVVGSFIAVQPLIDLAEKGAAALSF